MDLTCLTVYPPIPTVPKLANDSNTFTHQTYNPGSGGLAQAISASLARSTFSINDVRSLIDRILHDNSKSWSASEVVKIKPVPSIIIYTSITLVLFLVFSIIFCAVSCCHRKRHQVTNFYLLSNRLRNFPLLTETTTKINKKQSLCGSANHCLSAQYW